MRRLPILNSPGQSATVGSSQDQHARSPEKAQENANMTPSIARSARWTENTTSLNLRNDRDTMHFKQITSHANKAIKVVEGISGT
jgi:hypothetical protein